MPRPRPLSLLLSFLLLHTANLAQPLPADSLVAPNGALHLRLWLDAQGVPTYTVTHGTERVHLISNPLNREPTLRLRRASASGPCDFSHTVILQDWRSQLGP